MIHVFFQCSVCVLYLACVFLLRLVVACFYLAVVGRGVKGCVDLSGSSDSAVLFPAWRSRRHLNDSWQADQFSGLIASPSSDWGIGDAELAPSQISTRKIPAKMGGENENSSWVPSEQSILN